MVCFIRFSGIRNTDQMIKQLRDVWFGYHKMFAYIPFSRKTDATDANHVVHSKVEK